MIGISSFIFAQENDTVQLKGDNSTVNIAEKTITYTGNVQLTSPFFTFEQAEKVIIDEKTDNIIIYKPKNIKYLSIEEIEKTPEEKEFIVFNTRTRKLTL